MPSEKKHLKIGIISENGELVDVLGAAIIRGFIMGKGLNKSDITLIDNAHVEIEAPDRTYTLICFTNILDWYSVNVSQMAHKTKETDGLIVIEDTKKDPDKVLLNKYIGLGGILGSAVVFYLNDDDNPDTNYRSERQNRWAAALDDLLIEYGMKASLSRMYSTGSVHRALENPYGLDSDHVIDTLVFAANLGQLAQSSGKQMASKASSVGGGTGTASPKTTYTSESSSSYKKKNYTGKIVVALLVLAIGAGAFYFLSLRPKQQLSEAMQYLDAGDYNKACDILDKLRDSATVKSTVKEQAEKLIQEKEYETAYRLLETIQDKETVKAFKQDLALQMIDAEEYNAAYELLVSIGERNLVKENKYERAMKAIRTEDYETAYDLLNDKDLEYYEDSKDQKKAIESDYNLVMALKLFSDRNFAEGSSWLDKAGESEQIKAKRYDAAMQRIQIGEYEAAWTLLNNLDYKDSGEKQKSIRKNYRWEQLVNAEKGSIVGWGSYEQDNNFENGKEEIEWRVLERDGSRLFLISKYILDFMPYDTSGNYVTWETSTVRAWLNNVFYQEAFSDEERTKLMSVTVKADVNSGFPETDQGNDTQDIVFLLSTEEVLRLFDPDLYRHVDREAQSTAYVDYNENGNGKYVLRQWWLRTLAQDNLCAARIENNNEIEGINDGYRHSGGVGVESVQTGIRPAVWLDLEAGSLTD